MTNSRIDRVDVAGPGPAAADPSRAEREEIARLAREFEAMLLTQMLREMRRSMIDADEDETGFGGATLTDVGDVEFGRALSAQGGIGLTDALLRAFEQQLGTASRGAGAIAGETDAPVVAAGAAGSGAPGGTAGHDPLALVAGYAPVSSRFGWRDDPLNGARRFHQGIDIAMAYGQDVKAAAGGRVSFSGVQSGYGNTVVIDHADGRQTRYAHLAEQAVRAGDPVAEGQIIGKSGSSGRATGPHLHFELLVDGRPVDPRGMSAD
jgi:murein DD-endopeptidase MepM/ murein hydrolase activator NlpD